MTQHLIQYWQRLTHWEGDEDALEAPVLELAACFAKPAIAARRTGEVTRLTDAAKAQATAR